MKFFSTDNVCSVCDKYDFAPHILTSFSHKNCFPDDKIINLKWWAGLTKLCTILSPSSIQFQHICALWLIWPQMSHIWLHESHNLVAVQRGRLETNYHLELSLQLFSFHRQRYGVKSLGPRHRLHQLQLCPPGGATCIHCKLSHMYCYIALLVSSYQPGFHQYGP